MKNSVWINVPAGLFRTGLFDGITTVRELRTRGSFGVGEFEALGGELIARNGEFFKATADGKVRPAGDDERLAFAMVSSFTPQTYYTPPPGINFQTIQGYLSAKAPTLNTFYAFLIEGTFATISTMALPVHQKPYPPFEEALNSRHTFQFAGLKGKITAFYSPLYTAEIGVPGYHFHFVADDLRGGGHVTSFTLAEGTIAVERIDELVLALPEGPHFENATGAALVEVADGHGGCFGHPRK